MINSFEFDLRFNWYRRLLPMTLRKPCDWWISKSMLQLEWKLPIRILSSQVLREGFKRPEQNRARKHIFEIWQDIEWSRLDVTGIKEKSKSTGKSISDTQFSPRLLDCRAVWKGKVFRLDETKRIWRAKRAEWIWFLVVLVWNLKTFPIPSLSRSHDAIDLWQQFPVNI